MIVSFRNRDTRLFAETGRSKFRGLDESKARARLSALQAATSLASLSPLASVGLHKLTGNRRGYWAMTINGPWRLVFKFEDGHAQDVEIVDYH